MLTPSLCCRAWQHRCSTAGTHAAPAAAPPHRAGAGQPPAGSAAGPLAPQLGGGPRRSQPAQAGASGVWRAVRRPAGPCAGAAALRPGPCQAGPAAEQALSARQSWHRPHRHAYRRPQQRPAGRCNSGCLCPAEAAADCQAAAEAAGGIPAGSAAGLLQQVALGMLWCMTQFRVVLPVSMLCQNCLAMQLWHTGCRPRAWRLNRFGMQAAKPLACRLWSLHHGRHQYCLLAALPFPAVLACLSSLSQEEAPFVSAGP